MGWRRPCEALGKPKMPHHNVTPGPQWQTTSPRPTQVDDLSHLVRGEHCLPNSRGMTEVWGLLVQMGRTLRASSRAKFHGFTAGPYIPKMILETVGRVMHALGSGVRCGAILTDVAHHRTLCKCAVCMHILVRFRSARALQAATFSRLMCIISSRAPYLHSQVTTTVPALTCNEW